MAKVHGVAGEWARVNGVVFGLWPLFLAVFACGVSVTLLFVCPLCGVSLLVLTLIGVIMSLLAGLRRIERFFKGARGEEKVAGILSSLPDSYHVFNDFKAGNSRVDHVVVGPSGVYSIETKFWRGKVTIEDGHILLDNQLPDRPPLAQTVREASLVRSLLAKLGWVGVVTPVLVFASDTFEAHRANFKGTIIINSNELQCSFATDRVLIPQAELDRLVGIMESNS